MKTRVVGLIVLFAVFSGWNLCAYAALLTFDNINSLSEYSPAVTFSNNASIWTSPGATVLENPDGGAYSWPNGLQFGNAGGELGYVYFSTPQTNISIWALSGPGPDNLNTGMYIKAFDAVNNLIDEDYVNSDIQFDLLSLSGANIVKIEFWSPYAYNDVWDNLNFSAVPIPSSALLIWGGLVSLAGIKRKRFYQ